MCSLGFILQQNKTHNGHLNLRRKNRREVNSITLAHSIDGGIVLNFENTVKILPKYLEQKWYWRNWSLQDLSPFRLNSLIVKKSLYHIHLTGLE